ncbi:MAG: glycosyltransferase family 4 protein [Nitrospirae bacterium]|nr:glycosyltransferase family 4 protein [Nitrospirota bacterium]
MKLGVGAFDLGKLHTGIGIFSHHVAIGLMERFSEARTYALDAWETGRFSERTVLMRRSPFPKGWMGVAKRLHGYQIGLRSRVKADSRDLFYTTAHEGLLAPPCAQVVTLHDLIPLRFPDIHPKLRRYFQVVFPWILRASKGVVCASEATKRDLLSFYRFPEDRTCVSLEACDPAHFRRRTGRVVSAGLGWDRFFLFMGSTAMHKNVLRLVEAFSGLADHGGVGLVLAGPQDPRAGPGIEAAIHRLGLSDRIRMIGRVPAEEIPHWYSEALALVFPSLHEGFGLPPLEAMACGCPVISSNAASLPEVCGGAALYVDPLSVDSIRKAMNDILADERLRESLREKGLRQASAFTWEKTVERIAGFLLRVAS